MYKNSNNFIKNILGIMLFIGLFFWCDDVFAKTCEYTSPDARRGYYFQMSFEFDDNTGELKLDPNYRVPGYTYISLPDLASTGIDDLVEKDKYEYGVNADLYLKIKLNDDGSCPNFYLTREKNNTYYILPDYIDIQGNTDYWKKIRKKTSNSYIYVEHELKVCSDAKKNEIKTKAIELKDKYIDSNYLRWSNYITNTVENTNNISKAVCDQIKESYIDPIAGDLDNAINYIYQKNLDKFDDELLKIPSEVDCEISLDELENVAFEPNDWKTYLQRQVSSLISAAQNEKNECEAKLLEQEKIDKPEYDDRKEDTIDETNDALDDISEKFEELNEQREERIEKLYEKTIFSLGSDIGEATCDSLLSSDLIDLIDKIFTYIKIAAPILLVVFGTIDFGGAVISQDKDAFEKALSKFIKRALICVAIFFAPIIIKWLLENVTLNGKKIIDPMCGIK